MHVNPNLGPLAASAVHDTVVVVLAKAALDT